MIRRWFTKWTKRLIDALTCFLQNPLRAVAAGGLGFGVLFVILTTILTATMFIKTTELAVTVAPLLHNVILGVLGLIAVIALTFLGYRNVSASFAGASVTVSADAVEEARGSALDALEKISDAVDPEKS